MTIPKGFLFANGKWRKENRWTGNCTKLFWLLPWKSIFQTLWKYYFPAKKDNLWTKVLEFVLSPFFRVFWKIHCDFTFNQRFPFSPLFAQPVQFVLYCFSHEILFCLVSPQMLGKKRKWCEKFSLKFFDKIVREYESQHLRQIDPHQCQSQSVGCDGVRTERYVPPFDNWENFLFFSKETNIFVYLLHLDSGLFKPYSYTLRSS